MDDHHRLIATILASLAKRDKSAPPNWVLMQTLMDFENLMVVERRDFEGCVQIGTLAMDMVDDPLLKLAFRLLCVLNAKRRMPDADPEEILRLAQTLVEELRALEPSSRRDLLLARPMYDLGIFARANGRFQEAINFQIRARDAYNALGDDGRAAISSFLIPVENANLALSTWTNVPAAVNEVDLAWDRDTPVILTGASFWKVNPALHNIIAHAWGDLDLNTPTLNDCFAFLLDFVGTPEEGKLGSWLPLIQALNLMRQGKDEEALAAFEGIIGKEVELKNGEISVSALLFKARLLWEHDRVGEARLAYTAATEWKKLYGRVPKAIAQHERDILMSHNPAPTAQ